MNLKNQKNHSSDNYKQTDIGMIPADWTDKWTAFGTPLIVAVE